jgi:PIN domain nuclease of toxin-antitoxin system
VNLLLDTHAFLWFVLDDPALSATAKAHITGPANAKFISPASYWEIAIKMSMGKYSLTVPHDVFFETAITNNGFRVLHIEPHHTAQVVVLPFHHKDPFDRLLIAQAIVENMPIISADTTFDSYPVRRIW